MTYYGELAVDPTGPTVYGIAYKHVYNNQSNVEKFPLATGKYKWNEYKFGKPLDKDRVKIRHKCKNCFVNPEDWGRNMTGGNDYRALHQNHQFYCRNANTIFQDVSTQWNIT